MKYLFIGFILWGFTACIEDFPPLLDPFVDNSSGPMTEFEDVAYDDLYRKACHNCYEKQYAASFGEALNHTNTIEIDFWDKLNGSGAKKGQWFVRHDPITNIISGNDNCGTEGPNGSNDLDACLRNVNAWSATHPNHDVITIFLDKKEGWSNSKTNRDPAGLDSLLNLIFGNKLYKPADLKGSSSTLKQAVLDNGWPTMKDLEGKIIVALTGGVLLNGNKTLNQYVVERASNASMFMAPDVGSENDIMNKPIRFSDETASWVVFYNLSFNDHEQFLGSTVRSINGVSRLWGPKEDSETYSKLIDEELNFIALYDFKETSFNDGKMEGILP